MKRRLILWGAGGALVGLIAGSAPAHAAPEPSPHQGNGDIGGFHNVLPPGQGGVTNAAEAAAFSADGTRPPHDDDQSAMYFDLVHAVPGLRPHQLDEFFKEASFGVRPEERERTYSPRPDVTIVRDSFGVPHIYGADRAGAMFGAGYVAGEDRLFQIDIIRHAGRAELSSFIGGSEAKMDRETWPDVPYTEDELELQFQLADEVYGAEGAQLQRDAEQYTAGVNQYIAEARVDQSKMPVEYGALGHPEGPTDWKPTDTIAAASVIAGTLGRGGGKEVESALVLEAARERFGRRDGKRVWSDFRSAEDPEAPTTIRGKRFPYQRPPKRTRGLALPDRGTVRPEPVVIEASGSAAEGSPRSSGDLFGDLARAFGGLDASSNALLVAGRESASGKPLAVMGPQVAYWSPQILLEQSIHAPGGPAGPPLDARGASFPGTNLFVQLGRGRDYAWSATSAGQDIVDTFAVRLCEPDGEPPSLDSDHYRFRGRCRPFEVLDRHNSWVPTPGDTTEAGSQTLRALRSALGIVTHRAEIDGKPHAYTELRTTYFHEVDSARGFADFNNPDKMRSPRDLVRAACKIDYTFNWFYIDGKRISYFNSGAQPRRAKGVDPNFPTLGKRKYEWRGYVPPSEAIFSPDPVDPSEVEPNSASSKRIRCKKHPQVVDQRFLTSWNNKQARAFRAADDKFGYHSTYRSVPLDVRIRRAIRGKRKATLTELVEAMEDAGTVDLRGAEVLPWVLKVVDRGRPRGREVRRALRSLRTWVRAGAHRRDRDRGGTYDHARAVQIMDAWWPLLLEAQFKPTLGQKLLRRLQAMIAYDDHNREDHLGSAFQGGWYGYVIKDLRTLLGRDVRGRYSRIYCGKGDRGRCRKDLLASLRSALEIPYEELYRDTCDGGDRQWCHDSIQATELGLIGQPPQHWINRPSFQQVIEPTADP